MVGVSGSAGSRNAYQEFNLEHHDTSRSHKEIQEIFRGYTFSLNFFAKGGGRAMEKGFSFSIPQNNNKKILRKCLKKLLPS